ncbi:hypothetical protein Sjap_012622 [Stephania japonica]|uniref:O-methyltransferase n=1 Tax=Stephania japonica TaxID=461633 RepID=A0AAP0IX39_9MAGN|nr:COMT protein [Stephania japonica]
MSSRKEVMARNDEKQVDVESLLEAQSHLWNLTFGFINSMSLKCAIQLGIPDAIHQHGQPITLSQLIASLHLPIAKTDWLRRLLRLLVHSGLLAKTNNTNSSAANDQQDGDDDYLYHLTPTSSILVKEKFNNVSPFVLMMLDSALVSPWHVLSDAFKRNEIEPFKVAHTTGLWDTPEDLNKAFNQAMASDAKFLMDIVVSNWGDDVFRGLKSIVDVGGGIGAAAFIIAKSFPHIKCTVLDLPQVAASTSKSEISMVEFVGGDMFEFIPPADAVLLKWILHDWNNKDCVRILKRCKEAIPSKEEGGRVIILDMVAESGDYGACSVSSVSWMVSFSCSISFGLFYSVCLEEKLKANEASVQKSFR